MTKEELEKEAEEKFKVFNEDKDREHYYDRMWFKNGYLAGAEPREKQIELLGERCNQLLKDKGGLTDRLEDLQEQNSEMFNTIALQEQQIEKMKCCGNCKYSNQEGAYTIVCKVGGVDKTDYIATDDNQVCDKWEIKENEK